MDSGETTEVVPHALLLAALRRYGAHDMNCMSFSAGYGFEGEGECTCGLERLQRQPDTEQQR